MNSATYQSVMSSLCAASAAQGLKSSIDHPRDASTRESYSNCKSSTPRASLWHVTGAQENDCEQLCAENEVTVTAESVQIQCPKSSRKFSFPLAQVQYMQRHTAECVQWTTQGEEYGCLFSSAAEASKFCHDYFSALHETCEELTECSGCQLVQYDVCSETFVPCQEQVSCSVVRSSNCAQEHYFLISSNGELTTVGRFDEDTSFFCDKEQRVVGCWPAIALGSQISSAVCGAKFRTAQEFQECWEECQQLRRDCSPQSNKAFMTCCSQGQPLQTTAAALKTSPSDNFAHEALVVCNGLVMAAKTEGIQNASQLHCYKMGKTGQKTLVSKLSAEEFKTKPGSMVAMETESRIAYNDKAQPFKLTTMDPATQKVVATWKTEHQVSGICHWTPTASQANLLCYNQQQLFALDTRTAHTQCQITYSCKPRFTCAATAKDGSIALGSAQGLLRLYDGKTNAANQLKRAKTQISVGSAPVIDIAVTQDGSWVLAVCPKYIALVPIRIPNSQENGFTRPLSKEKPTPIILKPTIDDVIKHNMTQINFQSARFDQMDTAVLACTGNLVLIWDFCHIQRGGEPMYSVMKIDDTVSQVLHYCSSNMETVVLATPSNVESCLLKRQDSSIN